MIGARLGSWIIVKEIGRGGMGTVYLAHEERNGTPLPEGPRRAAIKLLSPSLAQEHGFVQRFRREVEAVSKLKHPHIVAFYESGQFQGWPYYVMEYVDGPSFEDLLSAKGRMPWEDVIDSGIQICSALKHAHDHGIIHRDIKPTNLLVNKEGMVKLLDFGVARIFAERQLTATNAVVGTAEYLSPEQAAGKPVTRRSDLYSLGIVLYTMITGRTPFQAATTLDMLHKHRYARFDPPRKFVDDLPHDFDALICQLLEKEPDKRPPDAQVVGKALERLRRQVARKSQLTTDELRSSTTLGGTGIRVPDDDMGGLGPSGPATMMSEMMRAELEEMKEGGPLSRLLNRAWVLIFLIVILLGILIWGLWPISVEQRLDDVRRMLDRDEWTAARELLDKVEQQYPGHPYHVQVELYRERIAKRDAAVKARWNGKGTDTSPVPVISEAERFYREAQHEFEKGEFMRARQTWEKLIAAFDGVESQKQWVAKAREALQKADARDLAAVEDAIRIALTEKPAQAEKRLKALAELYRDRHDDAAKKAVERIERAIKELGKGEK
jgi:serine/threonine-protein kinase